MTSHIGRLYALALGLVAFFLAWAVIASHPWAAAPQDARLKALSAREATLRREAALVQKVVAKRWAAYRAELKLRQAAITAAKSAPTSQVASYRSASSAPATASSSVRVVTLPPITVTRTS